MPFKIKEQKNEWARENHWKYKDRQYERRKEYLNENPWQKTLAAIRSRCCNKKHHYYKNGIQNFLTSEEIKFLWFRDKAHSLDAPSIDRINTRGNYNVDNCRFIELKDNLRRKKKWK